MLRRYVLDIALVGILILVFYPYRATIIERAQVGWANVREYLFPTVPCVEPIPYTLGTFDARFNISQKSFLSAIAEAEAIWEKPSGRDLFVYTGDDSARILKVNLIYDHRQEVTTKLEDIGGVVDANRASYDKLKTQFETLKAAYESTKVTFNQDVTLFNQKQKSYEREVNSWNQKGGAPAGEYARLEARRKELEQESIELEKRQDKLNAMADEINNLVAEINKLARALNISVENYNATSIARGESFEEGIYSSDGFHRRIDIYEFGNRTKLIRVLAHEFGHALGLSHVSDSKAIMYEKNEATSLAATKADLDALATLCQVEE